MAPALRSFFGLPALSSWVRTVFWTLIALAVSPLVLLPTEACFPSLYKRLGSSTDLLDERFLVGCGVVSALLLLPVSLVLRRWHPDLGMIGVVLGVIEILLALLFPALG